MDFYTDSDILRFLNCVIAAGKDAEDALSLGMSLTCAAGLGFKLVSNIYITPLTRRYQGSSCSHTLEGSFTTKIWPHRSWIQTQIQAVQSTSIGYSNISILLEFFHNSLDLKFA